RPDAADADDLQREIGHAVALEEVAPVLRQRRPILREDLLEGRRATGDLHVLDHWRIVADHRPAVDERRELAGRPKRVAAAGGVEDLAEPAAGIGPGLESLAGRPLER